MSAPSAWTTHDEQMFIGHLEIPALKGYLKSLNLRSVWNGIEKEAAKKAAESRLHELENPNAKRSRRTTD